MRTRATQVKSVCARISHVITIIPARQLHFLANKNAEPAVRRQLTA